MYTNIFKDLCHVSSLSLSYQLPYLSTVTRVSIGIENHFEHSTRKAKGLSIDHLLHFLHHCLLSCKFPAIFTQEYTIYNHDSPLSS